MIQWPKRIDLADSANQVCDSGAADTSVPVDQLLFATTDSRSGTRTAGLLIELRIIKTN